MPLDASIEFPQADVRELFAQINRAQSALGRTMGHSLQMAVKHLMQSLMASTRQAPASRKVQEIAYNPKSGNAHYSRYKSFAVTGWMRDGKTGPRVNRTDIISAESIETAKRYHGSVPWMGLAKESWRAALRSKRMSFALGSAPSSRYVAKMKRAAAKYGKMQADFSGKSQDPYCIITNRLSYITAALAGGQQAVSTAMERAARGMMKSIDGQLAKKMGAA